MIWPYESWVAGPVACAVSVPSVVGQSMPKYGNPRRIFEAGTTAKYWSTVSRSLNIVLVSGDTAEPSDWRFSWYSITKNPSTDGARAGML